MLSPIGAQDICDDWPQAFDILAESPSPVATFGPASVRRSISHTCRACTSRRSGSRDSAIHGFILFVRDDVAVEAEQGRGLGRRQRVDALQRAVHDSRAGA